MTDVYTINTKITNHDQECWEMFKMGLEVTATPDTETLGTAFLSLDYLSA